MVKEKKSPSTNPETVKRSNKKQIKKPKSRREKRKKSPSSSSSFSSSSSSSSSTESENEMVDKWFKTIPKGEEFKWNNPSGKANYANLQFKNYIPDKDVHKKILPENPAHQIYRRYPYRMNL